MNLELNNQNQNFNIHEYLDGLDENVTFIHVSSKNINGSFPSLSRFMLTLRLTTSWVVRMGKLRATKPRPTHATANTGRQSSCLLVMIDHALRHC